MRLPQELRTRVAFVRIGFGLIWGIDAAYKWAPAFQHTYADMISQPALGAPALLRPWFHLWAALLAPHASFFAPCTAVAETLIALSLISGIARRPVYLLGALFSFLVWSVPESFGQFWRTGQTDLGTSIMYVFIFLTLFVVDSGSGSGALSLGGLLARRS